MRLQPYCDNFSEKRGGHFWGMEILGCIFRKNVSTYYDDDDRIALIFFFKKRTDTLLRQIKRQSKYFMAYAIIYTENITQKYLFDFS